MKKFLNTFRHNHLSMILFCSLFLMCGCRSKEDSKIDSLEKRIVKIEQRLSSIDSISGKVATLDLSSHDKSTTQVTKQVSNRNCPHCKGSGMCLWCYGKGGSETSYGSWSECVYCQGTGKCSYCKGTGIKNFSY
jgi:DnaJ-class molecular chaperone